MRTIRALGATWSVATHLVVSGLIGAQGLQMPASASEDERLAMTRLEAAGFSLSSSDLITALHHQRPDVVAAAVVVAPHFASEPGVVAALHSLLAASNPQDRIGVDVIASLQRIGATGWESSAIQRMRSARARLDRLHLSVTLARAGVPDGWPAVRDAIGDRDRFFALEGLVNVDHFDGLAQENGQPIDVVGELTALREQVVPELRQTLDITIERVARARAR